MVAVRTTRLFALAAVAALAPIAGCGEAAPQATAPPGLVVERTIELPGVQGRIDHLAIDVAGQRLFVAALGNGSVEVVDLAKGAVDARIGKLSEPQGLAYLSSRHELVVASGDGVVGFYAGGDLTRTGSLKLGDDADNVREAPASGQVVVGYGRGALAFIEPSTHRVVATMPMPAHPESFRFDAAGHRVFVNLPGAGKVAVGDVAGGKVVSMWKAAHSAGYPMAIEPGAGAVAVVYRLPSRLVLSNPDNGATIEDLAVCGDADDLFFDAKRHRLYVSCGSGSVDVFQAGSGGYRQAGRIDTRPGARTSLFVPELDRLFVAARAGNGKLAAILVMKPVN